MIHLKSYTPTHQQMARVEHAMVVNRRRYYALREAGMLDRAEEVRLDLELMNLSYWKYHSYHSQESQGVEKPVEIQDGYKETTNWVERGRCVRRILQPETRQRQILSAHPDTYSQGTKPQNNISDDESRTIEDKIPDTLEDRA